MAETLDENLNIISENETIEIELLDGDLNIIQKLDDEPNDVGGLTAAQLKAQFDKSGNIIKEYINNKLIPAVLAADATESARAAAENARVLAEQERVLAENRRSVWAQYAASAAYEPGNKVSWNGSSYVNIKACTGVAPDAPGGEEYWLLIAQKGDTGDKGEQGETGEQGDPFIYEDFTQEQLDDLAARATGLDRDSIIDDVIAALGTPVFGTLDEDNNIILTGDLANGTYTLKYEDSDGTVTEIGTVVISDESVVGDAIPLNLTLGKIDSGTGDITSSENYLYSDLVEIENGKTYTLSWTDCTVSVKACYYDADGGFLYCTSDPLDGEGTTGVLNSGSVTLPLADTASYFRLRVYCLYYNGGYGPSVELAQANMVLTASE